jgi:hypothetical protein
VEYKDGSRGLLKTEQQDEVGGSGGLMKEEPIHDGGSGGLMKEEPIHDGGSGGLMKEEPIHDGGSGDDGGLHGGGAFALPGYDEVGNRLEPRAR